MEKSKLKLNEAKEGWNKISNKKKITMVVLISSIALFAYLYSTFIGKSTYVTLFTNLEFADAGNIVSDLELKGIAYKLEENGSKILIDEKKVDKYRIQLAMDGNLPESSKGFEIFDDMGLMVTEDDRKIMYQRALAGELQRSIMSLEAINSAKVNLVVSEKSIFETEQRPATASIVIDVKPNQKVNDSMIKGIAALVSGAVLNLPEENIKIIDSKGNLLSGILVNKDGFSSLDIVNQHSAVKEEFEKKIENNLNELLGSAFGRDKIRVSVFADLDFDAEEVTNIEYRDPVTRSEQIEISGSNINPGALSGLIGENTSNVFEGDRIEDGENYSRTTNNELSTETKTVIKAPGKVNKITTSVVFDGTLSDDRSRSIQNIVKTATGFDEARGDQITVEGVMFDRTYETKIAEELKAIKEEEERSKGFLDKYGEYLVFALIASFGIAILVSLIGLLSSKKKEKGELISEPFMAYETPIDISQAIETAVEKIEVKPDKKRDKAQTYAKENPQLAADLIKVWMKD